ncbi:sensor histidine kinase [Niabella soli]|nr:HAMP domain-containing sensor histidine kinase [Niabella soli]
MKISQLFRRYWVGIVNMGIEPDLPLLESRRVQLMNMLAAIALPLVCFYPFLNWMQGRYFLAGINIINLLSMLMVLVFHKKHRYMAARYSRIGCCLFVYTISGCYFHTGAEYYLLNTLVLTIIIFDNKWVIAILSSLIITATVLSLTFPSPLQIGSPMGTGRVWSNIALSMLFTVLALYFFKSIQQDYQQAIEKQKQTLFHMNQDKEKLFSIIAHDIRSPLASLEVLMDQFQDGMLNEAELNEASSVIRSRVAGLNKTMDNLLRWSTIGMKGIKTHAEHFLILPVVEEVIQLFKAVAAQKRIHIEVQGDEELAVYADLDQVSVILRNLVSNALKFSYEDGRIVITADKIENQVWLRVADEGVGMDEQRAKALFAGLQQPGFGTHGERGTGLGLLLCKEFAQRNKGAIHAESEEGVGTTFTLTLQKGRMVSEKVPIN